ncbi:N-acetyltransferase GCN5 [Actinocatenispora thailandica]|uniref:N-acetyltransferase GCN5 n=1 Tax=Actinocatenispora thailandica TaxID=227318 RepID=A0A7R7DQ93_9ACTN|nr:GNAT family N-acetyltransferase [Actinocatenispora thailandica]BCJ35895.1 N-acetyltransferase GCN5 [Actinocatenispora thailandica]
MRTPISIRPATADDAAAIAEVHRQSRAATMPYLPPQRRGHDEVVRWVREVVLPGCRVLVAEADGTVVGYAALDGTLLDALYLRPERRRHGIGSLLLAAVREYSPECLTLHVFEANVDARAFYARHGFVEIGRGADNMEQLPELTLRWTARPGGADDHLPDRLQ